MKEKKNIVIVVLVLVLVIVLIYALNDKNHKTEIDYLVDNISTESYVFHNEDNEENRTIVSFNIYSQSDQRDKLPYNTYVHFNCHNVETDEIESVMEKNDNVRFDVIHTLPMSDMEPHNSVEFNAKYDYCNYVGMSLSFVD